MPDDLIAERDAIVAELTRLVQTVTEEELVHIAWADRGYDIDKHLAALREVIFNQACLMTDANYWYPAEVIELEGHSRENCLGHSFEITTAILMINEMLESTNIARTIGYMQFRWENIGDGYFKIDEGFLKPVLLGFYWLRYRSDEWFEDDGPIAVPTREEIQAM